MGTRCSWQNHNVCVFFISKYQHTPRFYFTFFDFYDTLITPNTTFWGYTMDNIDFINTEEYKAWDKKRKAYEKYYKVSKECSKKYLELYHKELDTNWQNELKEEQQQAIDKAKSIPAHSKKTKLLGGIIPLLCYAILILIACISDSKLFLIITSTIFALMYFLGYYPKLFDNVPVSEYEENKIKEECRCKKLGLSNDKHAKREESYPLYLDWLKAEIKYPEEYTHLPNDYTISTPQNERDVVSEYMEDFRSRMKTARMETGEKVRKKMDDRFKELDESKKHDSERMAHRSALHRCGKCKHYHSCSKIGVVNCGAFSPRY